MKKLALLALFSSSLLLQACSTTDAVSLPFDLASTTGDAASSASSSSDGDSSETAQAEQERFVESQITWIQRDAARGDGESLRALAQMLAEENPQEFALWAQQNYDMLFSDLADASELLRRIRDHRLN